jgi:hypothetical protein
MEKNPPPVSSLQPLIPAGIDYVVETCLAKDPLDNKRVAPISWTGYQTFFRRWQ